MRKNAEAFTLIEIAISVFILLLLLAMAVPSLNGVLADRRLRRSLDDLTKFVQTAQERSVSERRAYLITLGKDQLVLHPETLEKNEERTPMPALKVRKGDGFSLQLPAALIKDPPGEWIFWPTGTCEPALITFKGADGTWTARYSGLTVQPELSSYAAK